MIWEGEQMNNMANEQPTSLHIVRLYSAGLISLMTFLTSFPVGYVLAIINWHRMRNGDKERRYIFGLISSSLFMILLLPFYSQAGIGIFVIDIAFGVYFYNEMTQALNSYEQNGNTYIKDNLFAGCLVGILAAIVWIIIATILTSGISFLTDMLLFNVQR
jgi:hypothetical protein